jgi:CheY-like chemotaxis protein
MDNSLEKVANPDETLSTVVKLVRPMAEQYKVCLDVHTDDDLPQVMMHPVALNQTLLNLLGVAIHRAPGSRIAVSATLAEWEVEVRVEATGPQGDDRPTWNGDTGSLDMARRLVDMCGGQLTVDLEGGEPGAFDARLCLPALGRLPVLAIDDNEDTLRLLERYTAGTRYCLTGTRDPEQAVRLAEEVSPQIIVLDVMMPQVDGWQLLGWLRQHTQTHDIPVVVCTILGQEELAYSLGASDYVKKPITRQAFLDALDRQVGLRVPGSRSRP